MGVVAVVGSGGVRGGKAAVAVCLCNSATYKRVVGYLPGAEPLGSPLDLGRLLLFEQSSLCPAFTPSVSCRNASPVVRADHGRLLSSPLAYSLCYPSHLTYSPPTQN